MNILFVVYSPLGLGGAEVSTLTLAQELKTRGHNIFIASTGNYPGIETFLFRTYKKIPFYPIHTLYLKHFLKKIIKEKNIQIIHAQDRLTSIASIKAAQETGIKSVVHFRDYWFACPKSTCLRNDLKECSSCPIKDLSQCSSSLYRIPWDFYKLLYLRASRKTLEEANLKIGISSSVTQKLAQIGVTKNVYVLHNSRHLPQDVETTAKPKNELTITFFGSFFPTKGITMIIEIMKNIVQKNKNVHFLMVGDGPLYPTVQEFIQKNNLDRFKLLGRVPHDKTWSIYSMTDIVVFPSIWSEPFSGIPLECMFMGKPIIASNRGGTVDAVEDDKTGFLIDPSNTQLWEERIQLLIDNPTLRTKMGHAAKLKSKEFSPEKMVVKIEALYATLLTP